MRLKERVMDNGEDYFPSKEIIDAWDEYVVHLKEKHPAHRGEEWALPSEYQRIDDAVDGIRQISRWRTSLFYSIIFPNYFFIY